MAAFPETTHVVFLRELLEDEMALERLWKALASILEPLRSSPSRP